jgi:flavin-dependent dehydrogenase
MVGDTDVFIIGGGPAGLAAAIAARQQGLQVTVADGAEPPVDKACGEGLMPDTIGALLELGVAVDMADGFPFRGIRFLNNSSQVDASFPIGSGLGVRRPVLHQKMIERAQELGVSLLWKAPVTGFCSEGVVAAGSVFPTKWIVGADGIRSRVRRWAALDEYTRQESRYAFRRHYYVEPWSDCMEIYWSRDTQAYVTPVGNREVCVVLMSRNPGMRSSSIRDEFPQLANRLDSAKEAGREQGSVTSTHGLRRVYRGRVALIGDASGSVDAVTGGGLCLSFHQALTLAEALKSNNLCRYQVAHRRFARRPTFMGRLMLMLGGHAGLQERAMRALASNPDLFARLLAVHVGATSPIHFAATSALLGLRFVTA